MTRKQSKRVPASDTEAAARKIKTDRDGLVRCRVCGCTEREPCCPPCGWADIDLCSGCADVVTILLDYAEGAHRFSVAGLLREFACRRDLPADRPVARAVRVASNNYTRRLLR